MLTTSILMRGKKPYYCILLVLLCETLSPATIGDNYADTLKVLNDYFLPKKNVEFEIYKFRQTKQEVNESLDTYYTKLKQLAKYCEFDNIEKEIKSQIIQSCLSKQSSPQGSA